MSAKERVIGAPRYDGKKGPLDNDIRDIGDFDKNFPFQRVSIETQEIQPGLGGRPMATEADVTNVGFGAGENVVSVHIVQDMERLVRGRGEKLVTDFVRSAMLSEGLDPDRHVLPQKQRMLLHDKLVRSLRQRVRDDRMRADMTSTIQTLMLGKDDDPVIWSIDGGRTEVQCTVAQLRRALGMELSAFMALGDRERARAFRKINHRLRRTIDDDQRETTGKAERTQLHYQLLEWNRGDLRLERPQGSSLHHLLEYDSQIGGMFHLDMDDCQSVVVENNWGASVPPIDGEWRVMFPLMCWEFRISGVRVLAMTDWEGGGERAQMWIVYGRGGVWAIDDYYYECGHASLPPGIPHRIRQDGMGAEAGQDHEMRRVAAMVYACIRGICIMREAEVAEQHLIRSEKKPHRGGGQSRPGGPKAARDYYVVRLVNFERRAHRRVRSTGAGASGSRAPQRGHWRAATWVHYDDQDSGQEQYVNDGGFVVSRTWRKWHFAGDPKNIIHKEYKA